MTLLDSAAGARPHGSRAGYGTLQTNVHMVRRRVQVHEALDLSPSIVASVGDMRVVEFQWPGDPELAIASGDSGSVSVLHRQRPFGPKTRPKTHSKVGEHPTSVTSTDFDGDGNPDLATANSTADTVSVLLGTGAPNTTITKQPQAKIKTMKKKKVRVSFTSEDAGATVKCKLDKADYKPCTSPTSASRRRSSSG